MTKQGDAPQVAHPPFCLYDPRTSFRLYCQRLSDLLSADLADQHSASYLIWVNKVSWPDKRVTKQTLIVGDDHDNDCSSDNQCHSPHPGIGFLLSGAI